jgi:hypothetical protein
LGFQLAADAAKRSEMAGEKRILHAALRVKPFKNVTFSAARQAI